MENLKILFNYKNEIYEFDSAVKVCIFGAGIENEFDKRHGITELLKYTSFIFDLYIKDDNPTPLTNLCDYVAENWEKIKKDDKPLREVLCDFYNTIW